MRKSFNFKLKDLNIHRIIFIIVVFDVLFLLPPSDNLFSDEAKIKDVKGFPDVNTIEKIDYYKSAIPNTAKNRDKNYDKKGQMKDDSVPGINKSKIAENTNESLIPQIKIVIDKKNIYHYDIQKVYIYDYGRLVTNKFYMKVYYHGAVAPSFGMLKKISFVKLRNKKILKAVYLPNWNAPDGEYRVRIFYGTTELKTNNPLSFTIKRRKLRKIKNGLSVVDLEMNKTVTERIIRGISGNIKGPEGILEWASFLNADALWILAGETTSFPARKPLKGKEYWDAGPLNNLKMLEKYGKKYNISIGAYVISFFVPGKNGVPDRYRCGLGYNSEKDYLYKSRHISLSSENRIKDIINLVKQFQNDPYVSYIGFDFIRTGRADGYELVDEFVNDTNIRLNSNWYSQTRAERIKWLARKIEVEKNPIIIEKWRWWRAHKVALVVKRIIKEAEITKPVWVYTLGWEHGSEHGQDPVMFFDAGADIDAVMLYEANHDQYAKMMTQWQEYMSSKQGNILIGNCVDYKLLDSDKLTPPQELYRRNIVGSSELFKDGSTKGIFFHDIYRLLWGRKGNYESWQYALSFVSSVFNMRQSLGTTDILTDIMIKKNIENENMISGYIYLKNLGDRSLELHISSFPSGTVDFAPYKSNKQNKSKYLRLDIFDTEKISFKANKRDAFFRLQIGNRINYFFPIYY